MRGNPLRTVGIFSSSGCAHAKERRENRGHTSEGREQQEYGIILPYVFINLKDVVFRLMVSRRDKE